MTHPKPLVRSLLRILQRLDEDTEDDVDHQQASRSHRNKDPDTNDHRSRRSIDKEIDGESNKRYEKRSDVESSSRERRSRRDNAMIRGSTDGRGRTPSPKRNPAPKPPSRDCPSPVPKMVSTADVTPSDQQGWLIDQLRGRKVWCVISDMLFCVFEKEDSKVSKQVILLPGCKVRPIEFKSASQEGKILNGVARHFATKTISGVDKYQFLIENSSNRQKLMFGVSSKSDLDDWISVLETACCVDVSLDQQENEQNVTEGKPKRKLIMRRNRSNSPRTNQSGENGSSYSPAQTLPSRLDMNSFTLPTNHSHDVSKESIDHIRRRLRKENSENDFKHMPMKVQHSPEADDNNSVTKDENTGKGWGFSKLKSPLSLLRRKKRSSSADDAYRRRKMFPILEPDTISNPSLSPRLSGSQPSLASSLDSNTSCSNHDASFASSNDSKDSGKSKKRGFLSRSFDSDKQSKGARASIRKTASELKDKIFRNGKHEAIESPRSRSAGIKLKDLQNPSVSGYLQYRLAFKWTKVWCVLSRGCFYAFRTQKEEEFPVLALVLNQSAVSYVMDTDKHGKKLFAFKITQRHCKSVYICADDQKTLMLWMKDLQTEAVKVQVDDMLAIEIREKRSSQKKREARETKEKEAKEKLDAKREELKNKRNSCPDLGTNQEQGTETSFSTEKSESVNQNLNVYMGDLMGTSERLPREEKVKSEADDSEEKLARRDMATEHSKDSTSSRLNDITSKTPSLDSEQRLSTNSTGKFHSGYTGAEKQYGKPDEYGDTVLKRNSRHPIKRSSSFTKDERRVNNSYIPEPTTSFNVPAAESNHKSQANSFVNNNVPFTGQPSNFPDTLSSEAISSIPYSYQTTLNNFLSENETSDYDIDSTSPNTPVTNFQDFTYNDDQTIVEEDQIIQDSCNDIHESVIDSLYYDDALKHAWGMDEDFLLGIIKDKLRKRRDRCGYPANDDLQTTKDVNGDEAFIVYDDDGMETGVSSEVFGQPSEFQDQSYRLDLNDNQEDEDVFSPDLNYETEDGFMEGFLEKRVDSQWIKYWCSLKDGCLCFYVTPNDHISADSTDLTGYTIEQLVDRFQGKRFVLSLTHNDYVDILLSVDSRDELEVWHQCITDILTAKAKRLQDRSSKNSPVTEMETNETEPGKTSAPSVQNVKHKLLAEMLRQKMELQKIRAARSGARAWSNPDQDKDGSSPTTTSPSPSPMGSIEDRVRTLTRLRQRRMSTQIKMTTIQKQMEESNGTAREKKVVFQLVRRRPDLVQSHNVDQNRQSDLEQQFKRLSSRLQEIDSSISSQGVVSPRDEVTKSTLRHSCDSSLLKLAVNQAARDLHTPRNVEDDTPDNKKKTQDKEKNKDKDVVRSNSIKSSMQRFAHRTFARAHWNKVKKAALKTPINNNDNNTINANDNSPYDNNNVSLEKPPDVIDVTNNNNNHKGGDFTSHDSTIFAPPDSFRTDDHSIPNDNGTSPRKHRTPKERILSKLTASHSFNQIDKIASRLKTTSSSPSLFKLLSKHDNKKEHENGSSKSSSDGSSSPVPKLNLNFDRDETDSPSILSSNRSRDIHNTNSNTTKRDNVNSHHSFHTVSGSQETPEKGFHSDRGDNVRVRSGFYSARGERTNPNPNRYSWSYGVLSSNRREVNPNALAEIKAFEELSSKFLGIKET